MQNKWYLRCVVTVNDGWGMIMNGLDFAIVAEQNKIQYICQMYKNDSFWILQRKRSHHETNSLFLLPEWMATVYKLDFTKRKSQKVFGTTKLARVQIKWNLRCVVGLSTVVSLSACCSIFFGFVRRYAAEKFKNVHMIEVHENYFNRMGLQWYNCDWIPEWYVRNYLHVDEPVFAVDFLQFAYNWRV